MELFPSSGSFLFGKENNDAGTRIYELEQSTF